MSAKFGQNWLKIATVRVRTHMEMTRVVLQSVPCYAIAMGQSTRF